MSDFGDFNTSSEDPTADFLARERAVLGDDADLFSNNEADLVSPSLNLTSPIYNESPIIPQDGRDSVLSQQSFGIQAAEQQVAQEIEQDLFGESSFENNYPKAEDLESSQAFHKALLPEEEPETVRQWREKQAQIIAERDAESEKKKQDIINNAREEIDKFYEEYNDKKQRAIEENREREENHEKKRDDISSSSNIWDRVVQGVDVSNAKTGYHTQDVSRMKDLLLDLKKDSKAPGNIVDA